MGSAWGQQERGRGAGKWGQCIFSFSLNFVLHFYGKLAKIATRENRSIKKEEEAEEERKNETEKTAETEKEMLCGRWKKNLLKMTKIKSKMQPPLTQNINSRVLHTGSSSSEGSKESCGSYGR